MEKLPFFIVALPSALYELLLVNTQSISRIVVKFLRKRTTNSGNDSNTPQQSTTAGEIRSELAKIDSELRNVSMIHEFAKYQKAKRRRNALEDELARVSVAEADRLSAGERRVRFTLYFLYFLMFVVLSLTGGSNDSTPAAERAYLFPFVSISLASWFVLTSMSVHAILHCFVRSATAGRGEAQLGLPKSQSS